uniref:histone-lysine N-methyltransferase, H3 lysine-9 specific SUVH5-like n=1 Tax=Fragaria vesca subsp. vesca TaxID=101020 RepID=UPI0005CA5920|nr:PREDICTED: histone-lysine N-methyltransferase, H3 lysine-9 specific SUVH5-like [Fragaria vesca subsp. vesca]
MRTFRKWVNRDKGFENIPGVNVGDKFRHGAKMRVVGLHGDYNKGIDWLKDTKGNIIAKSIIDSHRYKNKRIYADLLIYTREGGNLDVSKQGEKDQEAKDENLALMNCFPSTPVRVIRYYEIGRESWYIYEGLYTIADYKQQKGGRGFHEFKFLMIRIPSQPKLKLPKVVMPR